MNRLLAAVSAVALAVAVAPAYAQTGPTDVPPAAVAINSPTYGGSTSTVERQAPSVAISFASANPCTQGGQLIGGGGPFSVGASWAGQNKTCADNNLVQTALTSYDHTHDRFWSDAAKRIFCKIDDVDDAAHAECAAAFAAHAAPVAPVAATPAPATVAVLTMRSPDSPVRIADAPIRYCPTGVPASMSASNCVPKPLEDLP